MYRRTIVGKFLVVLGLFLTLVAGASGLASYQSSSDYTAEMGTGLGVGASPATASTPAHQTTIRQADPRPTTLPMLDLPAVREEETLGLSSPPAANEFPRLAADPEVAYERLWFPERLVIPSIGVDAPVVQISYEEVEFGGKLYRQWGVPETYAAGWHRSSATLGLAGNTVFNGHHNTKGEIFRDLENLQIGDRIMIRSGDQTFAYSVMLKLIVPERDQPLETRIANARWIQSTPDERLTLVSCWPYITNTHRIIVVATPTALEAREGVE